jgi:hypothetical protein
MEFIAGSRLLIEPQQAAAVQTNQHSAYADIYRRVSIKKRLCVRCALCARQIIIRVLCALCARQIMIRVRCALCARQFLKNNNQYWKKAKISTFCHGSKCTLDDTVRNSPPNCINQGTCWWELDMKEEPCP